MARRRQSCSVPVNCSLQRMLEYFGIFPDLFLEFFLNSFVFLSEFVRISVAKQKVVRRRRSCSVPVDCNACRIRDQAERAIQSQSSRTGTWEPAQDPGRTHSNQFKLIQTHLNPFETISSHCKGRIVEEEHALIKAIDKRAFQTQI